MLSIVDPRPARHERKPEQQIAKRIEGDLSETAKTEADRETAHHEKRSAVTNRKSPPNFRVISEHVAGCRELIMFVTLFCGLLPSCPSGENPVIVMKLNPRSRGLGDILGMPTS